MVPSEDTWHVSRVQKRVSKFSNFWVKNLQKPDLFDLTDNFPRSPDNILSLGHCQIPSINCFTYIFALAPCVETFILLRDHVSVCGEGEVSQSGFTVPRAQLLIPWYATLFGPLLAVPEDQSGQSGQFSGVVFNSKQVFFSGVWPENACVKS